VAATRENIILLSIFFFAFSISLNIYRILSDDFIGYDYHINYPILCKIVELLYADIEEQTKPFFDIIPKDRYEITQIYPRLFELFW